MYFKEETIVHMGAYMSVVLENHQQLEDKSPLRVDRSFKYMQTFHVSHGSQNYTFPV